ncbi:hypothetical protein M513_09602 [Trichuris suis]|uniref:DIX domain protein n=1 Tax=Trichuris suis TaxID=68888 RepID=A0A085LWZ5_9BILA|nr:hypothetical protein M513_09602 [Trichuris suis]
MANETKVVYHIDEEPTPYLIKLSVASSQVTLGHFKSALNRPNFKYFFKAVDDDFGVVKEEISDENAKLPSFNGCVESWLVTADGSTNSDTSAPITQLSRPCPVSRTGPTRTPAVAPGRPAGFTDKDDFGLETSGCSSETESTISGLPKYRQARNGRGHGLDGNHPFTSDVDTTSYMESEDDRASRISSSTDVTSVSRQHLRRRKRRRNLRTVLSRASSVTSITESSMSLNIITVTLNMDTVNFLGISIVGHSNQLGGDGGIYVGSIMKGGAVALDGRIEPGDMILQVNDVSFENMSNDDAVRVLREAVQKPGPIKLVVAKCWDPNPKGYFTIPRTEPVRPIDPGAWVAHTNALRAEVPLDYPRPLSVNTATSNNSGSFSSPLPDGEGSFEEVRLDITVHDIAFIFRAMTRPDSGLEVHDRTWLKITIPNAFLGSDVVNWLYNNVHGFANRRDARKYASRMLREGYIKHTVNKITFAEQCYYVFGDICGNFASLKLNAHQEEHLPAHAERNARMPMHLNPPALSTLWPHNTASANYYTPQNLPPFAQTSSMASGYVPIPFQYNNDAGSFPSLVLGGGAQAAGRSEANSASNLNTSGSNQSERLCKVNVSGILSSVATPGLGGVYDPNATLTPYPGTGGQTASVSPPPVYSAVCHAFCRPSTQSLMTIETKVIYHIDDEPTPYLIKIPLANEDVTLGHFKGALNRPNFKYFFKSVDDDFGVVKEEISDDNAKLPTFNGCVESWLVTAEGSSHSDTNCPLVSRSSPRQHGPLRPGMDGIAAYYHHHGSRANGREIAEVSGCSSETESTLSGLPKFPRYGSKLDRRSFRPQFHDRVRSSKGSRRRCMEGRGGGGGLTSDLDSTSFMDSEDEQASRISSSTDITSVSRQHLKRRKRRNRYPHSIISRVFKASSVTSITESSMSLNIITVTLNMGNTTIYALPFFTFAFADTVNFLGISIVGHSNQLGGDGGIYVGSIMKGGAVALDGRIEPGDMILQVNEVSFENMSNDDAVRFLREAVQKPGPIKLVVAKCWDPNPKGYFTIPRTEPVRPIDPGAWVAHTNALRAEAPLDYHMPLTVNTAASNHSGSFISPHQEGDRFFEEVRLDVTVHDMAFIVRAMARPDSGLEIRDRTWLKITIPSAFLGSDVVDWLHCHVHGFADRRDARKYASRMLKEGYIKHTVNKITFAEQCYYVFGDICDSFARMRIEPGGESASSGTTDREVASLTTPLLAPSSMWPPSITHPFYGHQACPSFAQSPSVASGYVPVSFQQYSENGSYTSLTLGRPSNGAPPTSRSDANSGGSGSSKGSNESERVRKANVYQSGPSATPNTDVTKGALPGAVGSLKSHSPAPLSSVRPTDTKSDVSSRQSFRMAMGNPCEFFVDVM